VYNTQDYWVFGFYPSSGIKKHKKNTTFRKADLFPSLGEGWETPTLLDLLESATHWLRLFISNWTKANVSPTSKSEDGNRFFFRNVVNLCVSEYRKMVKVQKQNNLVFLMELIESNKNYCKLNIKYYCNILYTIKVLLNLYYVYLISEVGTAQSVQWRASRLA
jgi:hypothetical protein